MSCAQLPYAVVDVVVLCCGVSASWACACVVCVWLNETSGACERRALSVHVLGQVLLRGANSAQLRAMCCNKRTAGNVESGRNPVLRAKAKVKPSCRISVRSRLACDCRAWERRS